MPNSRDDFESIRGEEVSYDDVVDSSSVVQERDMLEEHDARLQQRLLQLHALNPLRNSKGHSSLLHTAVETAVAFWERVRQLSLTAREIPQLDVGKEYVRFYYGQHAPDNRFEMWIGLEGRVLFTLYLDGSIAAFARHARIDFATDILVEQYFLAPFLRQSVPCL
jgi:hypothetical protein